MIKYNELPVEDRMIFFDLLVNGEINPEKNKYMLSMATGKKYRIELIDGEYYFDETKIGYDKVNIKDEKAKKLSELSAEELDVISRYLQKIFEELEDSDNVSLIDVKNHKKYVFRLCADGLMVKTSYVRGIPKDDRNADYIIHSSKDVGDIQLDNPIHLGNNHFITYMSFNSKEFHNIPNRLIDVDFDNNTITDIEFDEKGVTKRIDEYIAPNSSKHLYNSLKEN